jgi:hypothetical protein
VHVKNWRPHVLLVFPSSRASHGLIGFVGEWLAKGWQWLGGSGTNRWGMMRRSFWWWFGCMRMNTERDMIGYVFVVFLEMLVFPSSRASHGLIGFVGGWWENGWQWLGGSGTNRWGIVLRSFWCVGRWL